MKKVKVLFFTADPRLGRPGGEPLELAEDLRQIRRHVRQARYGHRLVFDPHGAARADDLIDLLENTDAQVVHFSGHGGEEGLQLVGRGGQRPHLVDAAALKRLFRTGHGAVRLAVLSACSSEAEAQAIADVVGCAIGTLTEIGDDAAITFNSRFYQAIANGHAVHHAHEKACAALQVHRIPKREYPRVFVRDSRADLADLVLVKTHRIVPSRMAAAVVAFVLTSAMVRIPPRPVLPELTASDVACGAVSPVSGIRSPAGGGAAASERPGEPMGAAATLANAKAFYQARNYDEAAHAFEQAAQAGNGEAMGCLGYMYLSGRGRDPQPATGIEWLRRAASEERDAHGMYALAMAYLNGHGGDRVEHLADDWLEKAAAQDYAEAMRSLGILHQAKMNDSSYRQALDWYRKALNAGSVDARVDIGRMYEWGLAVRRNPAEAYRWYHSAAVARSPHGMLAVGKSYEKGVGVPQDYAQAMRWYRKAAKAGSAEAMNSMGVLYENGLGVRKSRGKAIRWYEHAAQAGSPLAKGNLAALGRD
jgi:TPR repeat protein